MASIDYFGLKLTDIEFVNSEAFRATLEAHPNLRLVTIYEDEYGDDTAVDITIPIQECHDAYVGIEDRDNDETFLWVLYDDCETVIDPSPAFIEILKLMDAYSIRTLEERIFSTNDGDDLDIPYPEILKAEFDFTTGDYLPL